MHGALFLLLYRRGGQLNVAQDLSAARAYCVVAKDTYTPGASAAQGYTAGAAREQTYHAGATAADVC